jgi:hypothetical protein
MKAFNRTIPGLRILLVGSTLFAALGTFGHLPSPRAQEPTTSTGASPTWKVTVPPSGNPWSIAFGSGTEFPQFAALDPRSGYFRLVCKTTWGTSIVLPPSFWSGGVLRQGMPLEASYRVEGERLLIDASGVRDGLTVHLRVSLSPPGDGRIAAEVNGRCEGNIALDTRPGEAFKPVMLSSMRVSPTKSVAQSTEWDASSVILDEAPPLKFDDSTRSSGFFVAPTPRVQARRFGFRGGKSAWQPLEPAPTVEILLDGPLQVAGYRTQSTNHDDDNLGLWAATENVLGSWHYTIVASRPSE